MKSTSAVWMVLAALSAGCAHRGVTFELSSEKVIVQRDALFPETLVYSAKRDAFIVGSFRDGGIYELDDDGGVRRIVEDPRLSSVLGVAIDEARGLVWAVSSDIGASLRPHPEGPKRRAAVGVYDLETGSALAFVELTSLVPGAHLANGIALDNAGNAYVTDSLAPAIYKVEPTGRASVFARDPRFAGDGIALNGVVVHPSGFLLVVKKDDGALFKIPLDAPLDVSRVSMRERLVGGDGLVLTATNALVVIANRTASVTSDRAISLYTDDDWASASVGDTMSLGDVYPTTGVLRDGRLYVVHSHLNALIGAPRERQAELRTRATIRAIGVVD